jgi:cytochrome c oxidase cbb3-type subunit 1
MGESVSLNPSSEITLSRRAPQCVASAAWHSLLWLVVANSIGVLIAILLLFPNLNRLLGEWTYGRWIMVHMNLELYGWTSLPMVGFLFQIYGADRGPAAAWCRTVLWLWSAALGVGALSWLSGHSSGKLFLDWSGTARVAFPLAMLALWLFLAITFIRNWNTVANQRLAVRCAKIIGLVLLLAVPLVIYIACSPNLYPAINPDTGGPTGASQLESSLIVVAILLMLPYGLTRRKAGNSLWIKTAWVIVAAEFLLCFALGRADISHHRPAQYLSLASLLLWLPLTPAYYAAFEWHASTRRWRYAFLGWWSVLVLTGWIMFLPGVLDYFKFTDGLVGHSFIAMAGFTSALLIFVMVQLLGEEGWIFNRAWSFYVWNGSVLAYIVLMTVAGWREGFDPTFTIVPGMARNVLYVLRLVSGVLMFAAALEWFIDATKLLRESESVSLPLPVAQEVTQ